jgi:hypothetical protein
MHDELTLVLNYNLYGVDISRCGSSLHLTKGQHLTHVARRWAQFYFCAGRRRTNQFVSFVHGGGGCERIIFLSKSPAFAELAAVSGEMGLKNVSNLHRKTDLIGAERLKILNTYESSERAMPTDYTDKTQKQPL